MYIIQRPSALSFSRNLLPFKIGSFEQVSFSLYQGEELVLSQSYTPDATGVVEVQLKDIVHERLSCAISYSSTVYIQQHLVSDFLAVIDSQEVSFRVIRGGVDRFSDTASNFLTANFLTWQPVMKPVTYYTPEFLTYYATVNCIVRLKAHFPDDDGEPVPDVEYTVATLTSGNAYTIPLQYALVAGWLDGRLPAFYDVWVQNLQGERLTQVQRYYADSRRSADEEWVIFENSLGGIDTFRAYGKTSLEAEHTHNVAEIDEVSLEYRVDTSRKFHKNTGHLTDAERRWLLDFFPSPSKYVYVGNYIRPIVVHESNVTYGKTDLPSNYSFVYTYADAKPLLNFDRGEVPATMLDIKVPDLGNFTLAPRLAEFPSQLLDGGTLFPVQSPYSERWGKVSLGSLMLYFGALELIDQDTLSAALASLNEALREFVENYATSPEKLLERMKDYFLRKDRPDSTQYLLQLLGGAQFGEFVSGLQGGQIDNYGNGELESLVVRSFLQVTELLINRLQAQEGDTLFTDNDQIVSVEESVIGGVTHYTLTLKEKWEGYFTSQQYGNVLKGIINTLAAKAAGISDEESTSVEVDGANKYYTSWMRVTDTHNTDPLLDVNQIRVVLWGDNDVPAQRNFPPCELMVIARCGCVDYSAQYEGTPEYNSIVASIRRRQNVFMVDSTNGRIVKLTGVDKPKLVNGNYGITLGTLPEFVQLNRVVRERYVAGRDYLYAQGIVVSDFIQIDIEGVPVPTVVYCGDWADGSAGTPTVGSGIYLYNEFNETTQRYETHEVRHNGGRWRCLQHQPVISGGVAHYYAPAWDSPYWQLVDGNSNLTLEFVSSRGYSFRANSQFSTEITPHVFFGAVDITADLEAARFTWTRQSENGKTQQDETWDAQHAGVKSITLTRSDMPQQWSSTNKALFTLTVAVPDGRAEIIVQNQVIV